MIAIRKYFILIILTVILVVFFIISRIQKKALNQEGVITLGQIYYAEPSNRGTVYKYFYLLNGHQFDGGVTSIGWNKKNNDLIYVKVALSNPTIGEVLRDKVPLCFTINTQPSMGWKEIPLDTCR